MRGPTTHHARPGYDATPADAAGRVLPMLAAERVAWLSTVDAAGRPHLVPTWFWWDGASLLVFSRPEAVKVRNLRTNPRLTVALGNPDDDFAVGIIEAEARIEGAPARVPEPFFAKYEPELERGGLDRSSFATLYTQAIRIVPRRFLAWRGRGPGHEAGGPRATPIGAGGRSRLPAWA